MGKIVWDNDGSRYYETGVDRVVIYVQNEANAWNGVTAINESPSGAEPSKIYADNIMYGVAMSPEEDAFTVEAYAYPDLFNKCIGRKELGTGAYLGQQQHVPFGLCWRTLVGNDKNPKAGYKLHIVPLLYSSSSEDSNSAINDSPEQKTFSWSLTAIPVNIDDEHVTAVIVLDSRKFDEAGLWNALKAVEDLLYGTESSRPKIVFPRDVFAVVTKSRMLLDNNGRSILDSLGDTLQTAVYKTA